MPMPTVCVEMLHFVGDFDAAKRADALSQLKPSRVGSAPVILLEHLQPAHPQLVNLQFVDAQPAYGRLADTQPADRYSTDRQGAHCSCSDGRGKKSRERDR